MLSHTKSCALCAKPVHFDMGVIAPEPVHCAACADRRLSARLNGRTNELPPIPAALVRMLQATREALVAAAGEPRECPDDLTAVDWERVIADLEEMHHLACAAYLEAQGMPLEAQR